MADRVPVRRGRAAGILVRPGSLYVWIDHVRRTVHREPRDGLDLYRRQPDGSYAFVGDVESRCPGCGGFRPRNRFPCGFCGEAAPLADRGMPEPEG